MKISGFKCFVLGVAAGMALSCPAVQEHIRKVTNKVESSVASVVSRIASHKSKDDEDCASECPDYIFSRYER